MTVELLKHLSSYLSNEEMLDALKDVSTTLYARQREFLDLINSPDRIYYCPTCDQMVQILRPIPGFCPRPWRSDVFKLSTKSVRPLSG